MQNVTSRDGCAMKQNSRQAGISHPIARHSSLIQSRKLATLHAARDEQTVTQRRNRRARELARHISDAAERLEICASHTWHSAICTRDAHCARDAASAVVPHCGTTTAL